MKNKDSIKKKIIKEIESLSSSEQQIILGIVENYVHSKADETEWKKLPLGWKNRIEESLRQADEEQFILHEDAISYLRKKYRLNA